MIKSILGLEVLSLKSFITRYTPLHSLPDFVIEGGSTHFTVARLKPNKQSVEDPIPLLPITNDNHPTVESENYTFRMINTKVTRGYILSDLSRMENRVCYGLLIKGAIQDAREYLDIKDETPFEMENLNSLLKTLIYNGSHPDDLKLVRIAPKQWTILDINLFQLFYSGYSLSCAPPIYPHDSTYRLYQPYRLVVMKEHLVPNRILKR